jgi:hypothetical protein
MAKKPKAVAWEDEPMRIDPSVVALERRISNTRPTPGDDVGDDVPECFVPAPALEEWIRGTFVDPTGPLANERHQHLVDAKLGVLWTNAINVSKMRHVLGTAEIPQTMGGAWKRGRAEQQMREWFQFVPDFVLTFYAPECRLLSDRSFCALVEHELCHCAQAEDQYGAPKFGRMGEPIFAIRGHDVEEFTDVVARYGPTSSDVQEMIRVGSRRPLIGNDVIDIACGVCAKAAA